MEKWPSSVTPPPPIVREQARAPYRASIDIDIWQWDRSAAQEVLEQLVADLEKRSTIVGDGRSVYHRVLRTTLEVKHG